jgi:O-antigen/teichoic acid export membrane protein
MKIERAKNATRNIIFGLVLKLYQIVVPFFMRTTMIYLLGIEYLGLNGLFASILQVLNLAELGVGTAMVFSMYKPISEDDDVTICSLMHLYKIYYRIIGGVMLIVGLLLCPFVPSLIKSGIPVDMNIYILYLLNLAATVLTYWLFAYKNSLLQAYQRTDILSKITLCTNTVTYLLQFLLLFLFKDYYLYIITTLVLQAANNIATALITDKMYPRYHAKGRLPRDKVKEINHRIRDLFTSKVGLVIVNASATLVISAFLGLTFLAIYQNYFYLISSAIGFVAVIFSSCTAGIGNSIIIESEEKNYRDLKKFTLIIAWIAGFCASGFLCLMQSFMKLWVGEDLMLGFYAVIYFCLYIFIYEINNLLITYKDAAGIWHEDRFRPLLTALTNLILSIIMVQIWGIYGVLISGVLSMVVVGMPWLLHNLFTVLFKRNPWAYIRRLLIYTGATAFVCIITYVICNQLPKDGALWFVVKGVICCLVSNLLFFLLYSRLEEFSDIKRLIASIFTKIQFRNTRPVKGERDGWIKE